MDPRGCVDMSPTVESTLYHRVQSILREMDSQTSSHTGMLRWSLHKKLETHPSISVPLIRVLLEELEKADRTNCMMHVIPLLHTLSYVILQQSDSIPNSLCQRVCDCLRKMLTFPQPYASVALNKLRDFKMEMATPGVLYQRRLIAEQNIQNEHFAWQEKVFVIADPAVFSGPMGVAVRADLEVGNLSRDTLTHERSMLLHALHTVLGRGHQSSVLAEALEALEEDVVQKFTQEVVAAVVQSIEHGAGSSEDYQTKLHVIYNDILTAARGRGVSVAAPVHGSSLCNTPLPTPQMNFLLWTKEEDLWEALVDFAHTSTDGEHEEKRVSVQSVDSGIEKDFRDLQLDTEQPCASSPAFTYDRRYGAKSTKPADNWAKTEALREGWTHTARVVVMGDDRVLGRLATVYYSIREKESKCLSLKKVDLQLYYIPVTDEEPVLSSSPGIHGQLSLASLLGRIDPWYASNINSLGVMIPKLAKMHPKCNNKTSEENVFLLDALSYYLRCGTQTVYLPIYSVKLSLSTSDTEVEEMFLSHLHIDFPQFSQLKEKILEGSSKRQRRKTALTFGVVISVSYKKITVGKRGDVRGESLMTCGVEITTAPPTKSGGQDYLTVNFDSTNQAQRTEIRTQNLNIRAHEKRTFTVCLDKDSRRTYDNVQRIEISPCLDPGYGLQPEVKLNTYLNKNLSLPINTFSGIIL